MKDVEAKLQAVSMNLVTDKSELRTWKEAEEQTSKFYDQFIRESHPCKSASGEELWEFGKPLYDLQFDGVCMPELAKPQTVNLLTYWRVSLRMRQQS